MFVVIITNCGADPTVRNDEAKLGEWWKGTNKDLASLRNI